MKDLFKGALTVPNFITFARICLVPVFAVLYLKGELIPAVIVLAISGLTDLVDGKIARRFHQVSALGKILDPVADKLTQITVAILLLIKFLHAQSPVIHAFGYVFIVFLAKEGFMVLGGLAMLIVGLRPGAAEMPGKIATVVFYVVMTLIFAFGPEVGALTGLFTLPEVLTGILVVISAIMTLIALASYVPGIKKQVGEFFAEKRAAKGN
ncbi:MAG: CDP-alcohol phosphatidyltransferase family protein [Clostridia bacterium]|nr:CDP-alcohol phosphatidyltransferase family protein [Clostridia bacterium]